MNAVYFGETPVEIVAYLPESGTATVRFPEDRTADIAYSELVVAAEG